MGDTGRQVALLLRTAWRTDRWGSLGLLLEPVGMLRFPLFAWCLKLMADGATRHDLRLLATGAAGIAVTRMLWFLGLWTGSWIRVGLTERVGFAFDLEIARLTSELPGVEHHERPDIQDRLELLRQKQGVLGKSLSHLINAVNAVVAGAGTLAALAFASPWLLLLVPFALPMLPIRARQQRWFRDAEERFAEPVRRARHLRALAVDRNAGMELRVFGLESEVLARFRAAWGEAWDGMLRVERRAALATSAGELLFVAGYVGAVWLMLWRAAHGRATAGEVVMVVYLAQQVQGAVMNPIGRVARLGESLRAAGRLLWLQDYARGVPRGGSRPAPAQLTREIVFDHVSFRYPGTDRWALRDVSFRIPAGAVVALVGENGAGKTTLVKLLCRMYEPTEGRILVDGVELAEIGVEAWRTRLSAAFQDFARFELAALHAVGVGHLPRMDDRGAVRGALERAGGADVPGKLPRELDSQLGARWEGGVDLSTGQWQKLALGRALMRRDPLVVFFDEPTASLDAPTEHALFERYVAEARAGAARGAVTMLVTHRFSTVRSADLILVIDGGGVAERGGHDDLLRNDGLYAELYLMQARSYA